MPTTNTRLIAEKYYDAGNAFFQQGRFEEALIELRRAEDTFRKLDAGGHPFDPPLPNGVSGLANTLALSALCYEKIGDHRTALTYFESSFINAQFEKKQPFRDFTTRLSPHMLACYEKEIENIDVGMQRDLLNQAPKIDISYRFPFSLIKAVITFARLYELAPEKYGQFRDFYDRARKKDSQIRRQYKKACDLEEANRKLKEIDQVKSDFISIVSHELRTPLTSIKAFTELILLKPKMPSEKRNKLLTIINNETDRLARLINDVLDLTKIESGKLSWHITNLSFDDIIQTSVSGIQSLADNKSLVITTSVKRPLPSLLGDRDRLIQVITNILSNAIKFTPQGGKIRISAQHVKTPKPQIVVAVSDTGIGIPKGDLNLIFEKFRRSGDILTNNTEGTGLGLTITRQIVEYHGGTIWAESEQGSGSVFSFTLPLNKSWHLVGQQQSAVAHL